MILGQQTALAANERHPERTNFLCPGRPADGDGGFFRAGSRGRNRQQRADAGVPDDAQGWTWRLGGKHHGIAGIFQSDASNSGMVFVVILHLSPEHESAMPALLQRHTPMQVVQAEHGTKVEVRAKALLSLSPYRFPNQ